MSGKALVKPIGGGKPFQVDAEDAPAYANMVNSDGAPVYSVSPIDAVVEDGEGGLKRTILTAEQQKNFAEAGRGIYTSQEAYNLAAQIDQRRGEEVALQSGEAKYAALARIPGLNTFAERALLGKEDQVKYASDLKQAHPYLGAAGDIGRILATGGALGLPAMASTAVGISGMGGSTLAPIITGVALGAGAGLAENTLLEIQHAIDEDKPMTAELIIGAAGTGALWGGVAAGAIPAAGAVARGVRKVGQVAKNKGPTGWALKKVFGHFEDSAAVRSSQREAFEKALVKEQAEIGKFTPEGFSALKTEAARREYLERMRSLGSTVDIGYDEARLAAQRLKGVQKQVNAMRTQYKHLPVKMRDRIGDPEWRKTFEYTVKDVDGNEVVRWGWQDDHWSIVEEEMRARFSALTEAGYSTEARYLEELTTPAHRNSPGVVAGRLNQAYMEYGMDALSGKEGADAAKQVIKGLLGDTDVWGRRAATLNDNVVASMDDVLDAMKIIRGTNLPDRFDMVNPQTVQAYKTLPAMAKQMDDALATLSESNILSDKTIRGLRSNMNEYRRAFQEGAEAAETAGKMGEARRQALKLNAERLGKNTAPTVGSETVVEIGKAMGRGLQQLDEATKYIGRAIENQSFQNKFRKARLGVYAVRDLDDEQRKELYQDVQQVVEEYHQNPHARVERIGQAVERIAATDNGIADTMASYLDEQMQYLADAMPVTPVGAYGKPLPPADSEIDSFLETVGAIQNWGSVLASVAEGSVTPEAANAMRDLAPSLFNRARADVAQIIEGMDPFDVEDNILSGLNIFMGEMDPIYTPDFIMRLQERTSPAAQGGGTAQQQPSNPNALTSVPQHQNPQTGVTPGNRLGSY